MNPEFGTYLCTTCGACPLCDDRVNQDGLVCFVCNTFFPVINGIPRFVPAVNYASSFGYQWNIHRKTQLDSHTGLPISRNRLYAVSGWSEHLKGERILEAGSGAGRFTEVLLQTGADVFSFDYSNAVEASRMNNGDKSNLHLFQGDIFNIPLPVESFDKVLCLGVLQHTPDPETAFKNLSRYVKTGGELVIDIYNNRLLSWLQWKYLLRPVTKRINKEILYKLIRTSVPILLPFTRFFRKNFGRAGARLSPIVEYSHLGLPPNINREWAILDTFDMYSPTHDHPQSIKTVKKWFADVGFIDAIVQYGPNGITGRGRKTGVIGKGRL